MGDTRVRADPISIYVDTATTFAHLVERIGPSAWDGPGLGAWDLRALVGHASRSLSTVLTYLDQPADTENIDSPSRYYAFARRYATGEGREAIVERGRRAGRELGEQPAQAVHDLVAHVTAKVSQADPDALITTIGGGMRVADYLPTRTFELVVHSLDIAAATGLEVSFSPSVLAHATELAASISVEFDQAVPVLRALTGRAPLPDGFSVV
jgi:uncharacterized protein (TIGR03083 family)